MEPATKYSIKANIPKLVTEHEERLIDFMREKGFGTIEKLMFKEGQPVRFEQLRQGFDL